MHQPRHCSLYVAQIALGGLVMEGVRRIAAYCNASRHVTLSHVTVIQDTVITNA